MRIRVAENGEAVKTQWPQGFWGELTVIMGIRVAKNGEAVKPNGHKAFEGN